MDTKLRVASVDAERIVEEGQKKAQELHRTLIAEVEEMRARLITEDSRLRSVRHDLSDREAELVARAAKLADQESMAASVQAVNGTTPARQLEI